MARNTARGDVQAIRRQKVASLLTRNARITQQQILDKLTEEGFVNPQTDSPWGIGTINRDVQAIREEARERLELDAAEWIARELETLEELQMDAWSAKELDTVLRILKRRAKLLGLDAPARQEIDHSGQVDTSVQIYMPDNGRDSE